MGNFGCDKLKLWHRDFAISNSREWAVIPNRKQPGEDKAHCTTLFSDAQGNYIQGERAYVNDEHFTAEVKNGLLFVTLNPSKLYHPFELTADSNQINEAVNRVQGVLKQNYGCEVNLINAGIGRIDITAQAQMNKIVPFYDSVIKAAKGSKRAPSTEYPNGFLIGNAVRELCTYDKGLKNAIDSRQQQPLSSNFMRSETRLLKSSGVKAHSTFAQLSDLLEQGERGMKYTYSRNLNALLPLQQEIPFIELSTLSDLLRQQINLHKQGQWLPVFIAILCKDDLTLPTAKEFESILTPLVSDEIISLRTAHRKRNEYQKMMHTITSSRAQYFADRERNYADMHREFKEKLIEPYLIAL
jgi:hypothetical protein